MEDVLRLLNHYSFDMGPFSPEKLGQRWQHLPAAWPRLAAIEALYQGRYKAVSVDRLLQAWQQRGTANVHFNRDFERLICAKVLPGSPAPVAPVTAPPPKFSAQAPRILLAESSLFVDKHCSICDLPPETPALTSP
ncbi:MAG: hypothetical protein SNJ60_05230 [Pseudanabaenaceae cyanobacterium]